MSSSSGFLWGGVLQGAEAYAVLAKCVIDSFFPIDLAFAWVNRPSKEICALLGQINFFQHFRVTFEAYNSIFRIEQIRLQ